MTVRCSPVLDGQLDPTTFLLNGLRSPLERRSSWTTKLDAYNISFGVRKVAVPPNGFLAENVDKTTPRRTSFATNVSTKHMLPCAAVVQDGHPVRHAFYEIDQVAPSCGGRPGRPLHPDSVTRAAGDLGRLGRPLREGALRMCGYSAA